MKYCKDCNYFRAPLMPGKFPLPPSAYVPKCSHPSAEIGIDYVFAQKEYYACVAMRNSTDPKVCGTEGQYYDPISPRAKPQ